MKIYLASASPRRQEILNQIGLDFTVKVSGADEHTDAKDPRSIVEELSIIKAQSVAKTLEEEGTSNYVVIGADTIVACDEKILGKPKNEKDAFDMLKSLSGRDHQVYTGVTIIMCRETNDSTLVTFHEKTTVNMFDLSDGQIEKYIASGEPMDKAGAYGIQGKAAVFVKGINGDYLNVVGLPVARLYHELCKLGAI